MPQGWRLTASKADARIVSISELPQCVREHAVLMTAPDGVHL